MNVEVVDAPLLPRRAATHIATLLTDAAGRRGRATLAVSGGSTPAGMLAALADLPVPWHAVHLFQVDERIAPDGDPARNLGQLMHDLVERLPADAHLAGLHPMSAGAALAGEDAPAAAATDYATLWDEVADVLAPMGLRLSVEKTRVVHIDEGFDFLGWRIQRPRWRGRDGKMAVYTYPLSRALGPVPSSFRRMPKCAADLRVCGFVVSPRDQLVARCDASNVIRM